MFQELITGGDLFSYLKHKGGRLHEAEAGIMIIQILEAVKYLHGKGIVHRDIKPENILMTSREEGARVVLSDFGHAFYNANDCKMIKRVKSMAGTFGTLAPYVLELPKSDTAVVNIL